MYGHTHGNGSTCMETHCSGGTCMDMHVIGDTCMDTHIVAGIHAGLDKSSVRTLRTTRK